MFSNTLWNNCNVIKIFNLSPEYSVKELKECIENNTIVPDTFDEAIFFEDATRNRNLIPAEDPDFYPLKFISKDGETQIWISGVTSGYDGTGPHCTLRCLRLMGFKLDEFCEHRLFTERFTTLRYTK